MPAYRTRDASARTLEVSTDAPPPPMVSIISPTPRAFTFPINDTRFPNSPSSSPFEPTLKSIPSTPPPLRPFSPTSSIGSDSSHSASVLSSPTGPPSSQASSHRRRRSTASDIGEQQRRPKKGDDDYIKRPENAFILFRRKKCEERQAAQEQQLQDDDGSAGPVKKQRQADLSKTISQQWKGLSPEERQYWEDLAKEKKKEHEAMYPNYVYRPQRTKDKKGKKGKSRNGELDTDTESSFSFLLPVSSSPTSRSLSRDYAPTHAHGHGHGHSHSHSHGQRRAVSAPTPPYQTIQLPTVWMPSCPTSPTLIPRISGRSPAPMANIPPPTESAPLTTFDYAPNDEQLFMPSYPSHATFDGSDLQQSHEVYQNMNMFELSTPENAGLGGPLLHALSIPSRDPNTMSPADAIASSLVSPSDTYASPTSSHGGPFTPADALRMLSLVQQKGVPEGVDPSTADNSNDDVGVVEMPPYGFWSTETLWANMDNLMPEDFSIGAIPPVELGMAQFEAMPTSTPQGYWTLGSVDQHQQQQQQHEDYTLDDAQMPMAMQGADDAGSCYAGAVDGHQGQMARPEEHDFDDGATPGAPDTYSGMFAHEQIQW